MRTPAIIILAIVFFIPFASVAQEKAESEEEIDEIFEWIQEEAVVFTEIATRTKMDADLVPGMVTILKGADLEARGARTVSEALDFVPGINTTINTMGDKLVSVRGIGGSFFSGNLKLLVDDIVVNDTSSAAGYVIYEIPVSQIDRIEIIRGPGSVIYGEYAYAGVINVKTKQKGNRLHIRAKGDDDSAYGWGGGGTVTYEKPDREFSLNLNLSGWESDGPDIEAGEDRLYEGFAGLKLGDYSFAPGETNETAEDRMAGLALKYKGFSLSGQYFSTARGDYFGVVQILPEHRGDVAQSYKHRNLEARYGFDLPASLEMNVKAGQRRFEFEFDELVALPPILNVQLALPDGTTIPIGDITPPDGSIAGPYYEETETYAGTELIRKGERHTLLLGLKFSGIKVDEVGVDTNTADENPGVMVRIEGDGSWLKMADRDVYSVYFQDMVEVADDLTLTAGVRYDYYDNHDDEAGTYDNLTPRLSAVYRLTDNHIFKAQYSEAVRPPSFTELYSIGNSLIAGNPKLEPEHIKSYELGYIFRKLKTVGRLTIFYSELEDNIEYPRYADPIGEGGELVQYFNAHDTIATRGFELEFGHDIVDNLRMTTSLSFADTEDETGEPLDGAANWIATAGIDYRPLTDCSLSLQYRYVDEIHRTPDDGRDNIDASNTVNIAGGVFNLFVEGLTLRAGLRNIFDEEIVHPSPPFKDAEGNVGYNYPDDFPRPGREWWTQVSYSF